MGPTGSTGPVGATGPRGATGPTGPGGTWSENGSNIFYNDGNVGIGTSTPSELLKVSKNQTTATRITTENLNTGNGWVDFQVLANGVTGQFQAIGSGHSATDIADYVRVHAEASAKGLIVHTKGTEGGIQFWVGDSDTRSASEKMRIDSNGHIGIGTSTPQSALHVAGGIQLSDDASDCTATKAGTLRWHGGTIEVCDGTSWEPIYSSPLGSQNNPGMTCLHILSEGASTGDGLYWIDPDGFGAVQVFCDMTTDGGGWIVCARQDFSASNRYLGRSQLSSVWGTVGSNQYGVNCASLMKRVSPGSSVEFLLNGSTADEWQWIYPFNVDNFYNRLITGTGNDCESGLPHITQCKGSMTSGNIIGVDKILACHNTSQHLTSDNYFIYQVSSAQNSNVLMELGQGDGNHPVGIRPDCGINGWWGSCSRLTNSYPYQSANYCSSGRDYGVVSVGFRERD